MVESAPADGTFRPKYHDYICALPFLRPAAAEAGPLFAPLPLKPCGVPADPLPGDWKIPTATPVIFDVAQRRQVTVQTQPIQLLYGGSSGPGFSWTADGQVRFRASERGYGRVYMEEIDPRNGDARTLIEEVAGEESSGFAPIVNSYGMVGDRTISDGKQVLWTSERDVSAHDIAGVWVAFFPECQQ